MPRMNGVCILAETLVRSPHKLCIFVTKTIIFTGSKYSSNIYLILQYAAWTNGALTTWGRETECLQEYSKLSKTSRWWPNEVPETVVIFLGTTPDIAAAY